MRHIQLKDAKAQLSSVVDEAVAGQPSVITRHGRPEAVLVGFEEWQRVSNLPSMADLILAFPGDADDLPSRGAGERLDTF